MYQRALDSPGRVIVASHGGDKTEYVCRWEIFRNLKRNQTDGFNRLQGTNSAFKMIRAQASYLIVPKSFSNRMKNTIVQLSY